MLGILIQLSVSWMLLWLIEKQDLSILGLNPKKERVWNFIFGFAASAGVFTIYCLTTTSLTNNYWSINSDFTANHFVSSTWWTIKSVIFEELIFRGALLYILVRKSSEMTGCLISTIAFGVYHWFSYGVFGNPIPMIYVFVTTGTWGLMFAFAYTRTKSLYLPTGLHVGWNLFSIVVFSQGPLGRQFLISSSNNEVLTGLPSIALQLFQLFALPILVFIYLKKYAQIARREIK